jgi:hypothetical protein
LAAEYNLPSIKLFLMGNPKFAPYLFDKEDNEIRLRERWRSKWGVGGKRKTIHHLNVTDLVILKRAPATRR